MSESTLSLSLTTIQALIGQFMGYGRTPGAWTAGAAAEVDDAITSGHRQFYVPPPVGGIVHRWSFMQPTTTLNTVANTGSYALPDAFAHLVGTLTFSANEAFKPLRTVGENRIRELLQNDSTVGMPQVAAIRWKASDGTTGQRQEVLFWPIPDSVYHLTYRYAVLPDAIATAKPWPLGGMGHAETILASCFAAAELRLEDARGERWAAFMDRLAASIALDRESHPESLGFNLDSGGSDPAEYRRHETNSTFTYLGAP